MSICCGCAIALVTPFFVISLIMTRLRFLLTSLGFFGGGASGSCLSCLSCFSGFSGRSGFFAAAFAGSFAFLGSGFFAAGFFAGLALCAPPCLAFAAGFFFLVTATSLTEHVS